MSNTRFLDTHQCVKTFYNRPESDLFIVQLGYHDFNMVKPYYHKQRQEFWTIHFVVGGKGELHYNNKSYNLGVGNVFVLPPNEWYTYFPDKNEPWEYIFFVVRGKLAKEYFESAGFNKDNPVRLVSNLEKIIHPFTKSFEKRKNNIPVSYFEISSLFFSALNFCLTTDSEMLSQDSKDIVEEAMNIINFRFTDPYLSISSIAEQLHISHTQLSHLFKKKTGMTMISYLNEQRMSYAEELFRTTRLKASEIALISGFNEYTYFLIKFKERNKITTSEFRNKHR